MKCVAPLLEPCRLPNRIQYAVMLVYPCLRYVSYVLPFMRRCTVKQALIRGGELFKMYIMNKHYNNRAVSNIIAALLLIAIAVAAAVLLYVFAIGLLGSLGSSGGQQTKEQVIMEAYSFPSTGATLTVVLRNVGSSSENLAGADYFVNGIKANTPATISICASPSAVPPGGSCQAILAFTFTSTLTAGAAYPFKIVTPTGGVFSYSVIYGGSS